jgi:hypothetical protein
MVAAKGAAPAGFGARRFRERGEPDLPGGARSGRGFHGTCHPQQAHCPTSAPRPLPAGIVLLKNRRFRGVGSPVLPLDRSRVKRVCVAGPLANSTEHMVRARAAAWEDGASARLGGPPQSSTAQRMGDRGSSGAGASQQPPSTPPRVSHRRLLTFTSQTSHHLPSQMGNYYGLYDTRSQSPLAAIRAELAPAGVEVRVPDMAMKTMALNYYDWPLESAVEVRLTGRRGGGGGPGGRGGGAGNGSWTA